MACRQGWRNSKRQWALFGQELKQKLRKTSGSPTLDTREERGTGANEINLFAVVSDTGAVNVETSKEGAQLLKGFCFRTHLFRIEMTYYKLSIIETLRQSKFHCSFSHRVREEDAKPFPLSLKSTSKVFISLFLNRKRSFYWVTYGGGFICSLCVSVSFSCHNNVP